MSIWICAPWCSFCSLFSRAYIYICTLALFFSWAYIICTSSLTSSSSHTYWFWHVQKMGDWNLVAILHCCLLVQKWLVACLAYKFFEFVNCWQQILYIFALKSKDQRFHILLGICIAEPLSWKLLPVEELQCWWLLDKELRNMQMNLGKGLPWQPCPLSFSHPHTRFCHHIQHLTHTHTHTHTHTQTQSHNLPFKDIVSRSWLGIRRKKAKWGEARSVGPPGSQGRPYIRQSTNGRAGWRGRRGSNHHHHVEICLYIQVSEFWNTQLMYVRSETSEQLLFAHG